MAAKIQNPDLFEVLVPKVDADGADKERRGIGYDDKGRRYEVEELVLNEFGPNEPAHVVGDAEHNYVAEPLCTGCQKAAACVGFVSVVGGVVTTILFQHPVFAVAGIMVGVVSAVTGICSSESEKPILDPNRVDDLEGGRERFEPQAHDVEG